MRSVCSDIVIAAKSLVLNSTFSTIVVNSVALLFAVLHC